MREIAFILQHSTCHSLILVDELGRGTSNVEGCAIAWSVCEYLMGIGKAYTIFITHFVQLAELELIYPNVKNYHMSVSTQSGKLDFLYNIEQGSCSEDRYGIALAQMLGFPNQIIDNAQRICDNVLTKQKENCRNDSLNQVSDKRANMDFAQRLINLKHSSLDLPTLKKYLSNLQKQMNPHH